METRGGITQTTLAVGTGGAMMVVSNEIRLLSGEIWWVGDGDDIHGVCISYYRVHV